MKFTPVNRYIEVKMIKKNLTNLKVESSSPTILNQQKSVMLLSK